METATSMAVEEITSVAGLEGLHEEWLALWRRCPAATPFQSPDWLVPWWKHLGSGELWVLALRQGGQLVGVAPFYIHVSPDSPQRQLLLLGTGISDYLDVLLEPGAERDGTAAIMGRLGRGAERWDCCDFQQLRPDSPLVEVELHPHWSSELAVQEVCPVLKLPERVEELPRSVPTHMLGKLWHCRRRADRFSARVEVVCAEGFANLFEEVLNLHQARWAARSSNGDLGQARLQEFHREAARRLLGAGALRLYGLRLSGRLAASFYGFHHGRRTYFYLSGFAPEFVSLSPATLMIGYAIEQAVREGAGEFDFLRGREAYKYLWGAKGRLNYRRRAGEARNIIRLHPQYKMAA